MIQPCSAALATIALLQPFAAAGTLPPSSAGVADGAQPPLVEDLNPDPTIFEVDIVAEVTTHEYVSGVPTEVWAFNGSVPGPTIEARLGQTLVVHFRNELPLPTSIHWHGMDVPANMDGSNISQEAVPPGGEFLYRFKLNREGHFWYHPHFSTNQMIERGLHGSILVRNPRTDRRVAVPRHREFVLTVDDVKLDAAGQVAVFATDLAAPLGPVDRAIELVNGREGNYLLTNGVHVGGAEIPTIDVVDDLPIRLRILAPTSGRFMRLSLADHELLQIGSDGSLLNEMVVREEIGFVPDHHGTGLASDPDPELGLLLTPSERADVVLVPRGDVGDEIYLQWHDFPRGRHSATVDGQGNVVLGHVHGEGELPPEDLLRLRFVDGHGDGWQPVMPLHGPHPVEAIPVAESTRRLSIFFGHGDPTPEGVVTFFSSVKMSDELQAALDSKLAAAEDPGNAGPIDGMVGPPPFTPLPFPILTGPDSIHVEVGEVCIWEVTSFTAGAHTFHTHGFPFQPLETIEVNLDGTTPEERVKRTALPLALKDNVIMPARPGAKGRSWTILRAAVQFDDSSIPYPFLRRTPLQMAARGKVPVTSEPLNPDEGTSGGWLAHCHILEHAARGMLSYFNVHLP